MVIISEFYMAWRKKFTKILTYRRGDVCPPMARRCRHRLCPDWLTRIIIIICRNWRENVDKNEFLFDSYPFEGIYVDGLTF